MTFHRREWWRRCAAVLLTLLLLPLPPVSVMAEEASGTRYFVDFDYLKQLAPDTVGWLYQPTGLFNAPVVYSDNSKYYKKYRYDKVYDALGSLFFTGDTAPDFTEPVLVMRGNNLVGDFLFGSFHLYRREPDYYQQNPCLYLLTPNGDYQLDIFAGIRTNQRDSNSWMVSGSSAELLDALPAILERSFLTPLPENLPDENDKWIILSAEGQSQESTRYVMYTRCRPLSYTGSETPLELTQLELDARETLNGMYKVDGVGEWMVYGQNDPSWDRLIFETETSTRRRPFGDGGCGPTSIALAIANLLKPEELLKINDYAPVSYGYTLCTCSVTRAFCHEYHVPQRIDTPEEMLRYFPLVIGSFATGFNTLEVQGRYDRFGTSMDYIHTLCETVYGLQVEKITDKERALEFLEKGMGMVVTCTVRGSPFTGSSHYITLAGADDTYLYILDPLRRDTYEELDPYEWVEIITPGLVRMKKSDALNITMSPLYLISRPETATETTQNP